MNEKRDRNCGRRKMWLAIGALTAVWGGSIVSAQQRATSNLQQPLLNDPHVAPGRLLAEGQNAVPVSPLNLLTYKLEEVELARPVELAIRGKTERFETALRLTITSKSIQVAPAIWIDDAVLTHIVGLGPTKIATIIYDRSILRDGAEISVTDYMGKQSYALPDRLKLPESLKATIKPPTEVGNAIVGIHSILRITSKVRQPLVQIEMITNRPFPVRDEGLHAQVGRKFFQNELGTAASGDTLALSLTLTLTLTPEAFAELKDGAEVLAFFNSPDRSGASAEEIWYFGRLNKSMLDK